jgi:hypothetical protein
MGKSAQARQAEKEWNEKYGNMTAHELENVVKQGIQKKFDDRRARAEQKLAEQEAKYNLPYGGLVKAVAKSSKQIKDLENKPDELMSAMREKLEEEFSELVNAGVFDENDVTAREMCISKKLIAYMDDPTGEYYKAKEELQQARNDYAIYLAKKEEWEQENADIINAERIRTKRAELMQADPEALRALGIEPDPVSITVASGVSGADTDDGKGALREALRSIHPSASDAEIESMIKLV